jgi:16S rRNA (cytidine1402-2'-O)-methyltransferase
LHNSVQKKKYNYGVLYVVATPIGNINDITYRAVEILSKVYLVASEDTRHSKKLLNFYGIKTKQISYHKYNEKQRCKYLINLLLEGKDIALISDAGTPAISDPGDIIISEAHNKKIHVSPIPGASSVISAISVSGYASNDFTFIGFLPKKNSQKIAVISENKLNNFSFVFFESPNRVIKTLEDIKEIYGGDKIVIIAREITKIYEEIKLLSVVDWLNYFAKNNNEKLKGEFVFIIPKDNIIDRDISEDELVNFINLLLDNDISFNTAIKIVCKKYNLNKNFMYKKYLNLAKK